MNDIASVISPLEMFYQWEASKPDTVYLQQPAKGEWSNYTWRDVGEQSRKIATALRAMGIENGERVCILSKNCAHWLMADLAIMMSGGASAPAFTTMTVGDVLYILKHSNSKVLIVGQADNWQSLKSVLPIDIQVISFPHADVPGAHFSWNSLLETHSPLAGSPQRELSDELTTIYTSGSTGKPKGVMYSFEGTGHIAKNLHETFRMEQQDRLISYLPLAHGFERALIDWMSMKSGFTIGFNEHQDSFAKDLKLVQPTVFHSVPRLWAKFQEGVVANFSGQRNLDALLSDPIQGEATIIKIKQALGLGEARLLLTGSAPTPVSQHEWYNALNMPLCEIYGQSEVLSGASNLPWDRKPGTLGKPTCNTEIKISDIGEILIKTKAVMMGYLHEPEKSAEALKGGWVHTGDQGEIDSEGYLILTGRMKEIFKTTKGKYIAPVPIEGLFISCSYLEQVCLIGSGLPQTALIAQLSVEGRETDQKIVANSLKEQVNTVNKDLDSHEKIASIFIVDSEWSSESDFLTHTMKIKRNHIEKAYLPLLAEYFDTGYSTDKPQVIWGLAALE